MVISRITTLILIGIFCVGCDPNAKPTYGKLGAPKNCRAIIQANIQSWHSKEFSAEDALTSIERNCGENGYSWGN